MNPAKYALAVTAGLLACWACPALAQRMQFPTAIPTNVATSDSDGSDSPATSGIEKSSGTPSTAWAFTPVAQQTYQPPPPSSYGPPTSGAAGAVAPPNYGAPLSQSATPPPGYTSPAPGYSMPPLPNYSPPPGYRPDVAPGPAATFQGGAQPAPAWDPYAPPGSQPQTLLPTDPCLPGGPPGPETTYARMQRLLQEIRFDYIWMPGSGESELGLNEFDFGATFGVPFFSLDAPLLITPGFGMQLWNGPPATRPMPSQTYSAYLDTAWAPQFTPIFGADLGVRIGVYSDFQKIVPESLRYTGHGLAVLSLSPSFQLKGGIMYLDRNRVKLLPTGGIIWTPHADIRFEILFPNPKLAKRLATYGNTDWWLYVRGEYGGGSWTISHPPPPAQVDYNDYRVAIGLEFDRFSGIDGLFEVGLAFQRELYGDDGTGTGNITAYFKPNSTVFLRGALAW